MRRTRSVRYRSPVESMERRVLFAAGALDPSFGGGGILRTNAADFKGRVAAIAIQPDGKVVAVGSVAQVGAEFANGVAVVRYNPDGSIDHSFGGGDGVATFNQLGGRGQSAHLTDVEILPDGDIVAAGSANEQTTDGRIRSYLIAVRLDSGGAADLSFGDGGMAVVNRVGGAGLRPRSGMDPRVGMDALPSGEVLVAGTMSVGSTMRPAVVKFTAAGTVDTSFGLPETPGLWTLPVDNAADDGAVARDVQARPDGRIVVVGDVTPWRQAFVAQLTAGGADDASFGGGDGLVRLDYSVGTDFLTRVTGNAVALQGDGKIVVAGHAAGNDMRGGFRVTRLNPDGSIDTPFGDNGTRPFTFAGVGGMPTDVALQADGKIVVGGFATRYATPGFVVGRLEADGDMDYTFGDHGRVYTPQYVGDLSYLFSQNPVDMGLLPDGKILMAGNYPFPSEPQYDDLTPVFARYLGDTVQPPPPPPPPPAQVWTIQAEDAEALDGTIVTTNHAGYTGRGFIDFIGNSGAGAGWTINDTPGAGTYTIEFRYANGGATARTMTLDASPARPAGPVSFAPTGGWSKWATKTVTVTMTQGIPTLQFSLTTTGQNGPNIDRIGVSYQPLASEDQLYQAENARLVGPTVRSSHPGFTGSGYADFTNASGDSIEWDVSAHEAGRYELAFRYANGALSDRPLQLSLNGDVLNGRLSFASTGSWSTWREVSMEVNLGNTGNRLRLATVGNNGPNIDVLTVRPMR